MKLPKSLEISDDRAFLKAFGGCSLSEAIKAQYQVLSDLRKVDEKIARLQDGVLKIPEDIAKIEAALTDRKALLEKDKAAFSEAEKKLRTAERDLKEWDDKLNKAESKMMEVKTNEEYQAAMKENEAQKVEKAKLEEQIIGLLGEVDSTRAAFQEIEKGFKDYEASMKSEKKKLEEERGKLVNILEEQLQVRGHVAAQLDPKIATLYNRMNRGSKSTVIAVTENELCLGCNMKIRPQLYNEVISFKAIHQCSSCGKLLVPKSMMDPGGLPDADKTAS